MKGFVKFLIIIGLIIIIVLLCRTSLKTDVEEDNENVIENSVIEDDNKLENNIENSIIESPVVESTSENNIYESDSDVGTTNKKQEAIDKVKELWGEDNTVTFRCDSITNNGEYIIAVVSTQTMTVKNYFRVNLEKGTVDVDY